MAIITPEQYTELEDRIDKVYMGSITVKDKVKRQPFKQFAFKKA